MATAKTPPFRSFYSNGLLRSHTHHVQNFAEGTKETPTFYHRGKKHPIACPPAKLHTPGCLVSRKPVSWLTSLPSP